MADGKKEVEIEHLRHALESRRQLRQATINFEHAALKPLYLLNGGGLIAFLTFLGTGAATNLEGGWTTAAMVIWLIGLVLAGFATAFGYQSQFEFYKAHGAYQQVQIGLKEYPRDNNISDEEMLKQAKEWGDYADCRRDRAHRFGLCSLAAFVIGAGCAIVGFAF